MTQDQYGQAQGVGYSVRGDVVEDENDEYADDQAKPMTRFQKVASALRGDRTDPQEPDDDQVVAGQAAPAQAGVTSPAAADSGMVAGSNGDPGPDMVAGSNGDPGPDVGADPDLVPSHQGTQPWPTRRDEGAVATGTADRAGDYWDESQAPMTGQDQVVAVTNPDVPVTDAGTDPLARPAEAADQTRPDLPNADLPEAQDPTGAQPDMYGAGAGVPAGSTGASTGSTGAGTGSTGAANGSAPYQDQAGAATISDVPVTQTAQDAAVTEAPGRTGRHAGGPAQELRPGEATDTLDDLGDLAYGNLLPEAADFTAQWQQIQFRFVDDPQASVTEAAEVVSQVTAKLEAAIAERQRAIQERQQAIQNRQRSLRDRWGEGSEADTETLRETLRMYRAFLDQLIGPKA
jgi:hypothetical protein